MANITRFDPFEDLPRLAPFRELDDWFRMPQVRTLWRNMPSEPDVKIDVSEDDRAYRVKADLPGVRKEDIGVSIDGNQVSISAEVRNEREERQGETRLRSERSYGMQSRTFTLLHEIDQARAEAKYSDGVLELALPKRIAASTRKLTVS